MILVLLGLNVVLQKDFDVRVHLWANVLQEKTRDDGKPAEANRCKRNSPERFVSQTAA